MLITLKGGFGSDIIIVLDKILADFYNLVGIAQLVRASDCGPEGRRFNSDFPPQILFLS